MNQTILTLPLLSLLFFTAIAATRPAHGEEEPPLKTFVFAGQSNMVGKRCRAADLPEELQKPNPSALFFDVASGKWVPVEPGKTEPRGFGPEIAFADAMAKRLGEPIGIIKHSKGGTNLVQQWNPRKEKSLYVELKQMVDKAAASRRIQVVGMLWVQGGADAKSEVASNAYAANLKQLVTTARADFGNPKLIFLSGRMPIKNEAVKPYWKTIRQAQQDLQLPGYGWVNCDDLTTGSDRIHYDATGMLTLGKRQATQLAELLQQSQATLRQQK